MATPAPLRATTYWLAVFRRAWKVGLLASLLSPTLFLGALGVGLGRAVDAGEGSANLGGVAYLVFLAPGLLAAMAVQTGAMEATYPVMGAVKWNRQYTAMLATPLAPRDLVLGHLTAIGLRVTLSAGCFVVVMALFGAVETWGVLLAVPAAVLAGVAVAAPVAAYTVTLDTDLPIAAILRFGITPMFLFSGTFFPISQLPDALEPLAWALPLWHAVELCRPLSLGTADAAASAGHVLYLVALAAAGVAVANRTYRRRLTP